MLCKRTKQSKLCADISKPIHNASNIAIERMNKLNTLLKIENKIKNTMWICWTIDLIIDHRVLCLWLWLCLYYNNFVIMIYVQFCYRCPCYNYNYYHSIKRAGRFVGVAYIIILCTLQPSCSSIRWLATSSNII